MPTSKDDESKIDPCVDSGAERLNRIMASLDAERSQENHARHLAGLEIVHRNEREGYPFALLLQHWGVTTIYGDDAGYFLDGIEHQRPERLEDKLARSLRELGLPIFSVREQGEMALGPFTTSNVAALNIPHGDWQATVHGLIRSADLIFCVFDFLGAGFKEEFRMIREEKKQPKTVVILPMVGGFVEGAASQQQRDAGFVDDFLRVIYSHELIVDNIMKTSVLSDLLQRMVSLSSMSTDQRMAIREGSEKERLPVTFEGVAEGYYDLASRYFESDLVESARCMEKALRVLYVRNEGSSWILDATICLANAWTRAGLQERARQVCQETRSYFASIDFARGVEQVDDLLRQLDE